MSIPCSNDDGNQAVFMGTNLENGDCLSMCGPCLPAYALTFAVSMTDGMPPEVAEMYAEQLTALSALLPASPPKTGGRRRNGSAAGAKSSTSEQNGETASPDASSTDGGTPSSPDHAISGAGKVDTIQPEPPDPRAHPDTDH